MDNKISSRSCDAVAKLGSPPVEGEGEAATLIPRFKSACLVLSALAVVVCLASAIAGAVILLYHTPPQTTTPAASYNCSSSASEISFFVVGDWGREHNSNQRNVAKQMGMLAGCYPSLSFIVSTGDNFYKYGLSSSEDPLFRSCFSDMYNSPSLQLPWYAVLGNHDYGDGAIFTRYSPLYQISRESNSVSLHDPRWNCRQGAWQMSFKSGVLDIIFVDSTPFLSKYHGHIFSYFPGGIESQDTKEQLQRIQDLLRSSTARFRVVVAHHPIHSFGAHCNFQAAADCAAMSFLEPILQEHQVDVYFAGHDHNLQLFSRPSDPTLHIVSGAGSNVRPGEFQQVPLELRSNLWMSESPGFVAASIKGDVLTLDFWDVSKSTKVYSIDKHAIR